MVLVRYRIVPLTLLVQNNALFLVFITSRQQRPEIEIFWVDDLLPCFLPNPSPKKRAGSIQPPTTDVVLSAIQETKANHSLQNCASAVSWDLATLYL